MSKLTWQEVHEIRKLCGWLVLTQADMASLYGVTQSLIAKIDNYRIWKSDAPDYPHRDHEYYARQYPGYEAAHHELARVLRERNRLDLWRQEWGALPETEPDNETNS